MRRYRLLLRLFPRAWRERYGPEVLDVLAADERPRLGPTLDLVHSGVLARVRRFEHLVWSGVRFARGRALALGAGLAVAAVAAFSLLTASVDVGTARIRGLVRRNWRGAYDLLVLPANSGPSASEPGHLVEANYLSAGGGITLAEHRKIARLPGIGVAAPLEIVGYVIETVSVPVNVSGLAGRSGAVVLRLTSRFVADNGLSKYPVQQAGYVYVTPDPVGGLSIDQRSQLIGRVERLPEGRNVLVCPASLRTQATQSSPFEGSSQFATGACYSRLDTPSGRLDGFVTWSFPVLVAGIDPAAEARLTGLDRAVTSGSYLSSRAGAREQDSHPVVPVLASTVTFDGDVDHVTVAALPASAVAIERSERPGLVASAVAKDRATAVSHVTVTAAEAWRQVLAATHQTYASGAAGVGVLAARVGTSGVLVLGSGPGRSAQCWRRTSDGSGCGRSIAAVGGPAVSEAVVGPGDGGREGCEARGAALAFDSVCKTYWSGSGVAVHALRALSFSVR